MTKQKILLVVAAAAFSFGITTAATTQLKHTQTALSSKPIGIIFNNASAETKLPYELVQPAPLTISPTLPPTPSSITPQVESAATSSSQPKIKTAVTEQPVVTAPPADPCEAGSFSAQFLCYINRYRKQNGKSALRYDTSLSSVALNHSTWMQTTTTFSHTGENGSKFFNRCESAKIKCSAENLATGFTTAKQLFSTWQSSPSHNANMLGSYSVAGLGISVGYATLLLR